MIDTRPRVKYVLPDGAPIVVIVPHGAQPAAVIPFELGPSDPLWPTAQPSRAGDWKRVVFATIAPGM